MNQKQFAALVVQLLIVIAGVHSCWAQHPDSTTYYLGVEIDLAYTRLLGARNFAFRTSAGDIPFTNLGDGYGSTLALSMYSPISKGFGWIARVELLQLNSSSSESEQGMFAHYDKHWEFAGASMLFKKEVRPGAYLLGGMGLYTITFDRFAGQLSTFGAQNIDIRNYVSVEYYNPLRADLKVGAGLILPFRFLGDLELTPELMIGIPLTSLYSPRVQNIYAQQNTMPPNLFYATLGFKLNIPIFYDKPVQSILQDSSGVEPYIPLLYLHFPVAPLGVAAPERIISPSIEHEVQRAPLVLHFAFNRSDITPSDSLQLHALTTQLAFHPETNLEIVGHTDSVGSDIYNNNLALRRATGVQTFLSSHGVSRDRMTANGVGRKQPVGLNSTDEGRAENRRVVVRLTN